MVPELDAITAIENEYRPPGGKPRLGDAYALLKARWYAGRRDLETGLRLMFLAWYDCAEPPCFTGLPVDEDTAGIFREVFSHFGGTECAEPELLYAVGLMAELFPWCCGDEAEWLAFSAHCRTEAGRLKPEGYPPEHFEGRGAYGDYFAHMARLAQGRE
jgi:hypothetical protein